MVVTERPAKGSGVLPALAPAGGQCLGVKRASVRQPMAVSCITVQHSGRQPPAAGSTWKVPGLQLGTDICFRVTSVTQCEFGEPRAAGGHPVRLQMQSTLSWDPLSS